MSIKLQTRFTICLLFLSTIVATPVLSQVKVPGVIAPEENIKRLPSRLIIDPIMMEYFEAPINTKQIESNVIEYLPGKVIKDNYIISVLADKDSHSIVEISKPASRKGSNASKKIYEYNEPKRLLGLKYYKDNNGNWELQQEDIYTYPGMGGNRALPMRKTQKITGNDTIVISQPQEETYVYDSHMNLIEYTTDGQTYKNQYNEQHNLDSSKITSNDGKWKLLEYKYQYENGLWIKKQEYETTANQSRFLKKSIERKLTF